MTEQEHLNDAIENALNNRNGRMEWTLERGQGQTYNTGLPTLYAHDAHPRHSVLAGDDRRRYISEFESVEQAMEMLKGHRILPHLDNMIDGGSTHIDVDAATSHPSDRPDFDW